MKTYTADEAIIKKAIIAITDALQEADIPQLEGAIAMQALLSNLADKGLDVRAERTLQSLTGVK